MKKKWVAVYAVYEEGEFLSHSIKSIIDSVDRMIIVEGRWVDDDKLKRSKDNTLSVLTEIQKEYPEKVLILYENRRNEQRQRDAYLELLEDGDHIIWLDGDEIVKKEEVEDAKKYAEFMFSSGSEMIFAHYVNVFPGNLAFETPHIRGFMYHFRKDLRHLDNERVERKPDEIYLFRDYGKGPLYNKSMPVVDRAIIQIFHYKWCKNIENLRDRQAIYNKTWGTDVQVQEKTKIIQSIIENNGKIFEGELPL